MSNSVSTLLTRNPHDVFGRWNLPPAALSPRGFIH
jgi:hypothetical protein